MATTAGNDSEAVKSGSAATEDLQSAISNVQSQIDLLAGLNQRLQTLRQLPGGVLRSELVLGANQVLQTLTLKDMFGKSAEDLRTLHAAALEGKMQDALRAAAESEQRDKTAIKDARERETQKRWCVSTPRAFARSFLLFKKKRNLTFLPVRVVVHSADRGYPPFFLSFSCCSRSPTPESPRPYLPLQQKVASPFPPLPAGVLPLTLKDLPSYIREFNSTRAKKVLLHIYLAPGHESRDVAVPVVLRFLIPDVLRAFITLGHEEGTDHHVVSESPALMVESLTVFGSREKASAFDEDG